MRQGSDDTDTSSRTVRSLLKSLRNYELSTSGKDDLDKEKSENPNYKKDIISYLDVVYKKNKDLPHSDSKEKKSVHFTTKGDSSNDNTSKDRKSKWPKCQSEVRESYRFYNTTRSDLVPMNIDSFLYVSLN